MFANEFGNTLVTGVGRKGRYRRKKILVPGHIPVPTSTNPTPSIPSHAGQSISLKIRDAPGIIEMPIKKISYELPKHLMIRGRF